MSTYDLIDPSTLTGDDAMAHNFLTRAARAILAVPSLVGQMSALQKELEWLRTERDTIVAQKADLEAILNTRDERIEMLERDNRELTEALVTSRREAEDRQRDVHILDARVEQLAKDLDARNLMIGELSAIKADQEDTIRRHETTIAERDAELREVWDDNAKLTTCRDHKVEQLAKLHEQLRKMTSIFQAALPSPEVEDAEFREVGEG